ncbi:oxygenase MpaB family protein [Streptomyces europaeiscabiei]|uniref:oxygenase MpaB family protein n=1 Tax=Streptomyces europaeiscabiei TaxID=146819 RepID=UPI0029ACBF84|nr:oxygenase MpaB family protein [Streptomyces europaeiscabiei]MDX3848410.1 oxygenase MpaB family protein [Streptomyces europaeiscabiei]
MAKPKRSEVEPHEDYGFFGPGSVVWKVWSYPTAPTVGFQRAVVVEELDPPLVAAVHATQGIYRRSRTRYDRTLRYFAMVAFAGSREVCGAADVLVRIHSKAIGRLPYGDGTYDANDPASQLWIQLTGWHSILYAYEKYGPGRLTAREEKEYWEACAVAAELQTCSPDDIPRSRDGVRAYFERMRPQLSASPIARQAMNHLLRSELVFPPTPRWAKPVTLAVAKAQRIATLATMPRWMREMAGIRQSRLLDTLIVPVMKTAFALAHLSPRAELRLLARLSPSTVAVIAPMKLGIPPRNEEVLTPAEARARHGYAKPAEAHLAFRALQAARVFEDGEAPSDQGLVESQEILGPLS